LSPCEPESPKFEIEDGYTKQSQNQTAPRYEYRDTDDVTLATNLDALCITATTKVNTQTDARLFGKEESSFENEIEYDSDESTESLIALCKGLQLRSPLIDKFNLAETDTIVSDSSVGISHQVSQQNSLGKPQCSSKDSDCSSIYSIFNEY
jgi:hypothetical protein